MNSHLLLWRGGLYDLPPATRATHPVADLLNLPPPLKPPAADAPTLKPRALRRRVHIWELNTNLHCSVIGTCLSAAELRRILVRLEIAGIETADEHELHMLGVLLANRPKEGGKLLQRALDRRHQVALNQFARAKDDAAIAALWQRAITGGDIPGAYWAVLTHPDASDKMVQKAFGDVHMLSHLMGATNCADLQRMRKLEDELEALTDKLERQQRHLRDGFIERDGKIARLTSALAEKIHADSRQPGGHDSSDPTALKETIARLNERLSSEAARRERLELRLSGLSDAENARRRTEGERDALRQELDALESQLSASLGETGDSAAMHLDGATVLYVGGRAHQLSRFRALVERAGGRFIHHDGGVEDAAALLPGLVSRSDVTLLPVDCVSHNAMTAAKRACQQLDKPFVPLRTSSLACLLAALSGLNAPAAEG